MNHHGTEAAHPDYLTIERSDAYRVNGMDLYNIVDVLAKASHGNQVKNRLPWDSTNVVQTLTFVASSIPFWQL